MWISPPAPTGPTPRTSGALLRPYHARQRAEIERLGGTLDKFIGDGIMAVFGAPVAHEDDPERAVRCALRMLAAIEELNQDHPSLDLAVRIGITTGEALVRLGPGQQTEGGRGRGQHRLLLQGSPRPAGWWWVRPPTGPPAGPSTTGSWGRCGSRARPTRCRWRLEGARSHTGIEAVRRSAAPFVGRQAELELLEGLFERTLAERAVRLVTIVGEPGWASPASSASWPPTPTPGRSWSSGARAVACPMATGSRSGPWVVKAQAGILETDPPDPATAKLQAAVADLVPDPSEGEWLRARLAPLLGIAGPDAVKAERAELFAAWRRFVEALAAANPLVLVVEDLHWADPAMLEFLQHLAERPAACRC